MFEDLMIKMKYKTINGKWDWDEIKYDMVVYSIMAVTIFIAIKYGD